MNLHVGAARLFAVILTLLMALTPPQARAVPLADGGALARWVDETLAPALIDTLTRHPRFRGETLDFVALSGGAPQTDSTALHAALVQRLRQQLLRADGIRLLAPGLTVSCSAVDSADLLLGIEISSLAGGAGSVGGAGREARVSLAVLDVAESVWVSGVSHAWAGRLTASERAALAVRTRSAEPGSAASPLSADVPDGIAAALGARLECALPMGITGRTHLDAGTGGVDARVTAALRKTLLVTPLLVLTTDEGDADWTLRIRSDRALSGTTQPLTELQLLLTDARTGASQQVAAVFVTGTGEALAASPAPSPIRAPTPAPATAPTSAPTTAPVTAPTPAPAVRHEPSWTPPIAEPQRLLGALALRQVAPAGICSDPWGRVRACAEVTVELLAPGHLFVVTTRDGAAQPLSCAVRPERSSAGERVFRFEVEDLRGGAADESTAPDAGIYVLAAADRAVASELGKALRRAPGACGTPARRGTAAWIEALREVLARYPDEIHWRALHMVRDDARIVRI